MSEPAYVPVACAVHDRLERWAVRREAVEVFWVEGGGERSAVTEITDVFASDGADWVRLGTGAEVRADRLVRVSGVEVAGRC